MMCVLWCQPIAFCKKCCVVAIVVVALFVIIQFKFISELQFITMAALGFEILVPCVPLPGAIPYTITGAESQVISFTLKPGKNSMNDVIGSS
jgi:hypothetical protein